MKINAIGKSSIIWKVSQHFHKIIFQSLFSIFFRGLSVEERAQQRKDKNRERMSKLRQPKLLSQGSSTKPSSSTSGPYAPLTLSSQGSSAQSFHSSQGSLEQSKPSSQELSTQYKPLSQGSSSAQESSGSIEREM